jgi:hypothetical protein
MNTIVTVSAIALTAAASLYWLGNLLMWSLVRAFGWRSPLRLAVVLFLWCVASTLLVLPLFAMLLVPGVLAETRDSWLFSTWVVGCFGASTVPFALVVGRRREQVLSALAT